MISVATIVLLAGSVRPPCRAGNVGEIWPPVADREMMLLAREGQLRICTLGLWKHEWKSPTVTLDQVQLNASKNKSHFPSLTKR